MEQVSNGRARNSEERLGSAHGGAEPSIGLIRYAVEIPPHANIQREVRLQLDVILQERADFFVPPGVLCYFALQPLRIRPDGLESGLGALAKLSL